MSRTFNDTSGAKYLVDVIISCSPRRIPSVRFTAVVLLLALVAACGCRRDTIERATVSGMVTLDEKPLPSGQIRFLPIGETVGPVWSALIKDGRYTTEGTKGTPVGELRVEFEAYRTPAWYKPTGRAAPGEEKPMVPQEQYLSAKFHIQSDLKMNIPPGSGAVEKDWNLTTR